MKKKICLLFLGLFLLTGCSVEYNVEIDNDKVKVNGELVETNSANWNKTVITNQEEDVDYNQDPSACSDGSCGIEDGPSDTSSLTFSELVDLKTVNPDSRLPDLKRIKEDTRLGISLYKEYNLRNFDALRKIPGITSCYKNFSIINNPNKNGILISSSRENICFKQYDILDEVKITLKTNHKVESHNADEVVDGKYIWKINRGNYNNKSIQLNLLNETTKKMDLTLLIILIGVILIVVVCGGIITLFIYSKSKHVNKID